ncbi:transposase [Nocardia terpenica]|uniref:Transposase n=1 Tax=Nocardia terpenica TaxID=455432 RepID=A0A6G9ZEM2_9NOCA|nr:transposase [Nocardia terpenica]QIS23443.1 transposase [Nocardia terpenica]
MAVDRRYPPELRERAVALVAQYERESGGARGTMARVARDLGIHKEALRHWVKQAKAGQPSAAGESAPLPESVADKDARIRELEARLREVERANQILKAASAFFARELDPPPPKW